MPALDNEGRSIQSTRAVGNNLQGRGDVSHAAAGYYRYYLPSFFRRYEIEITFSPHYSHMYPSLYCTVDPRQTQSSKRQQQQQVLGETFKTHTHCTTLNIQIQKVHTKIQNNRFPSFSSVSGVMTVETDVMIPLKRASTSARLPFRTTKSTLVVFSSSPHGFALQ